jgi:hypothetical protein
MYYCWGASVKSAAVRFLMLSSVPFKEAFWVRVRLASYFFTLRRLTHSENMSRDGQEASVIITMTA